MIAFGFKHTNSESYKYIIDGTNSVNDFIDIAKNLPFKRILGLGQYSGKDKSKIRIELQCNNKFRNNIISSSTEIISTNPWFVESEDFVYAKAMGNSYCNLVSYKLMGSINNLVEYTFLHIPKEYDLQKAVNIINQQIV